MTHGVTTYQKGLCRCDVCREANRINTRRSRLRRQGWTEQEYAEAWNSQGGVCAICGQPETRLPVRGNDTQVLSADHNHKTGRRRGLLCSHCNRVLGLAGDSPVWLKAATSYLAEYAPPSEATKRRLEGRPFPCCLFADQQGEKVAKEHAEAHEA